MKVYNNNNKSSLQIDRMQRCGNRIYFCVNVVLFDKETDTDIRFETESYVAIDEWQQKCDLWQLQNRMELENFTFQVNRDIPNPDNLKYICYDYVYYLSSTINNCHLTSYFTLKEPFENAFMDEISNAIKSLPDTGSDIPSFPAKDKLIRVTLRRTWTENYLVGRLLEVDSDSFHFSRNYYFMIEYDSIDSERIRDYNEGRIEKIGPGGDLVEANFNRVDGESIVKGWGIDFASIQNEIDFEGPAEITWLDE